MEKKHCMNWSARTPRSQQKLRWTSGPSHYTMRLGRSAIDRSVGVRRALPAHSPADPATNRRPSDNPTRQKINESSRKLILIKKWTIRQYCFVWKNWNYSTINLMFIKKLRKVWFSSENKYIWCSSNNLSRVTRNAFSVHSIYVNIDRKIYCFLLL